MRLLRFNLWRTRRYNPQIGVARVGGAVLRGLLYLLLVAPIALFVLHAFSTRWFYPQVLPTEWTSTPFLRLLSEPRTQLALLQSVQIALLTSGLSLLVAFPAARTLGMREFPGRNMVLLLLFLPTVAPPIAVGMGLNILFLRLDLAGTPLGVALVHLIPTLPYAVFALTGVFARYDPHYEHQALVLGAGRVRIFFTITLRLVLPGVLVATLFAFLVSWSQYLLTLLIGGGRVITLPVLLFSAVSGGNSTTIAVLALLFAAPPILIIIATARYLTDQEGVVREF